MKLLSELIRMSEKIEDIVDIKPDYVSPPRKNKKRKFPTSDKAEQSIINTLWLYNNADAS